MKADPKECSGTRSSERALRVFEDNGQPVFRKTSYTLRIARLTYHQQSCRLIYSFVLFDEWPYTSSTLMKLSITVALCIALPSSGASDNHFKVVYDGGSISDVKVGKELKLFIDASQIRLAKNKENVLTIQPTRSWRSATARTSIAAWAPPSGSQSSRLVSARSWRLRSRRSTSWALPGMTPARRRNCVPGEQD